MTWLLWPVVPYVVQHILKVLYTCVSDDQIGYMLSSKCKSIQRKQNIGDYLDNIDLQFNSLYSIGVKWL